MRSLTYKDMVREMGEEANLLVTFDPENLFAARYEVKQVLKEVCEGNSEFIHSKIHGLFKIRIDMDPKEAPIKRINIQTRHFYKTRLLIIRRALSLGYVRSIGEVVGLDVTTGKRPGTTRRISKYPLSGDLVLVDMPGFGRMMRASKRLEDKINDQIIKFLESNFQSIALADDRTQFSGFAKLGYLKMYVPAFIVLD